VPFAENSESRKSQLALAIAQGASIVVWSRKNNGPDCTAYRWATESKVRARIKAYRRRAVGRLACMVQIVCFGRNMLWRHMKVAFRGANGDTGTLVTLNCNLLLNHAALWATRQKNGIMAPGRCHPCKEQTATASRVHDAWIQNGSEC
jgi:hypothetical protein